jgi:hypothetical protein
MAVSFATAILAWSAQPPCVADGSALPFSTAAIDPIVPAIRMAALTLAAGKSASAQTISAVMMDLQLAMYPKSRTGRPFRQVTRA